jgi:AcrR family transcriptional regulator
VNVLTQSVQLDRRTAIKHDLIAEGQITDPASPKGMVLDHAARLFRDRGFERTTVRDLAREVGILPGSIFHHFQSKDEILRIVMRESIILNLARVRAALAEAHGPVESLRALIESELWAINGDTGEAWTVLVREWRSLSDAGQANILELRDEYEALWLSVLEQAHDQGLLQSQPFVLRRLLVGALSWTVNWYRPDGGLSLEDLTDEVLALAIADRRG